MLKFEKNIQLEEKTVTIAAAVVDAAGADAVDVAAAAAAAALDVALRCGGDSSTRGPELPRALPCRRPRFPRGRSLSRSGTRTGSWRDCGGK